MANNDSKITDALTDLLRTIVREELDRLVVQAPATTTQKGRRGRPLASLYQELPTDPAARLEKLRRRVCDRMQREGLQLRRTRGEARRAEVGDFHVFDVRTKQIVQTHADVEAVALRYSRR